MRRALGLALCVFGLSACAGGDGNPAEGHLAASQTALSFGIGSYVAAGDHVKLYGAHGDLLGVLALSAPTETSRLVTIDYFDGASFEDTVTRPLANGQFVAPVREGREGAILADAVLAPLFARRALTFQLLEPPPADGASGGLRSSNTAFCGDIGFPTGCASEWSTCDESGYWTQCECDFGQQRDESCCYSYVSSAFVKADCPRVSCSSGQRDCVAKREDCVEPGSCSFTAYGWIGCTSATAPDCSPY